MTTITDAAAIAEAFAGFEYCNAGAFPTSRCMPAPYDKDQEWAGHGKLKDGTPAKVYHIFTADEADSEDAGDFPWDAEHVSKIEIAEADEDGEFEDL